MSTHMHIPFDDVVKVELADGDGVVIGGALVTRWPVQVVAERDGYVRTAYFTRSDGSRLGPVDLGIEGGAHLAAGMAVEIPQPMITRAY